MKPALTQERLKELLHYDPETGEFTWRISRRSDRVGTHAGTRSRYDYIKISIDGVKRRAHRLAFLYMTGELPPEIDHINRDQSDNRWANLRPASRSENLANTGPCSRNTSGYRGVSWNKRRGEWQAYGKRDGRKLHLGYFTNLEEAAAAAQKWRKENFGVFAAV